MFRYGYSDNFSGIFGHNAVLQIAAVLDVSIMNTPYLSILPPNKYMRSSLEDTFRGSVQGLQTLRISMLKYGLKRKIPTRTNTGELCLLSGDGKVWLASKSVRILGIGEALRSS